jgi:transposase
VRRRERYHGILLLLDGKSCPEIAQGLYRDEGTICSWVQAVNEAGRFCRKVTFLRVRESVSH